MEILPGVEDQEFIPTRKTVESGAVKVDTGSTRARAGEVIRQVGGIIVVKPAIRDKRYRQGV